MARFGRLCGMYFEELEITGTSQNEQCMGTLAYVTEKLRIPQGIYSSASLGKPSWKGQGEKWKVSTLKE